MMPASAATLSASCRVLRCCAAFRQFGTGFRVSFHVVGIVAQMTDAFPEFVHICVFASKVMVTFALFMSYEHSFTPGHCGIFSIIIFLHCSHVPLVWIVTVCVLDCCCAKRVNAIANITTKERILFINECLLINFKKSATKIQYFRKRRATCFIKNVKIRILL